MTTRRIASLSLAGMALAASLFTALPAMAQNAAPKVQLKTSMGDIVLELNEAKAPKTVANFIAYAEKGHFDGTVFHRVIPGFMIQGGGLDASLTEKPTRAPFPLEADNGLKHDRGTIAMARTGNPNSATSQFFINVVNNDMLNAPKPDGHGYAVFGRVVQGMDVVDKIRTVATGNQGMHQNVPTKPVTILSATEVK
jgi:peptidyl-prolyl cis-trans isomerase A (cyclophilin A)